MHLLQLQTSSQQYEPLVGALTDYCIKDMGMMLKSSALANISGMQLSVLSKSHC
jgi:hypothetical protein